MFVLSIAFVEVDPVLEVSNHCSLYASQFENNYVIVLQCMVYHVDHHPLLLMMHPFDSASDAVLRLL